MRKWINLFEDLTDDYSPEEEAEFEAANRGVYKGKKFWSGAADTRDGYIIEVHTYEEAVDADFHHSFYFSDKAIRAMAKGTAAFFWVDQKGLQTNWREAIKPEIRVAILSQIEILP